MFGDSIYTCVKLFRKNALSTENQGGNLSEVFNIRRGSRQGQPLSFVWFVLKFLQYILGKQGK